MKKEISHTFSLGQLVLFSLPAVAMLMVTSLYTAVDGVFIARYVGSDALSAINIMLPLDTLSYGVAIMLGTGASAVIGRKLGQGRTQEAYENFSLVTVAAVVIGLALSVGITVFFEPLAVWLGAAACASPKSSWLEEGSCAQAVGKLIKTAPKTNNRNSSPAIALFIFFSKQ